MPFGLKVVLVSMTLFGVAATPAIADSCADARREADRADNALLTRSVDTFGKLLFNHEPASRQKATCENERVILEMDKDVLRRHRIVDNACGNRIRWKTCDTACALRAVRKQEKKVAYECDPARIPEAIEKARLEREEIDRKRRKENEEMNAQIDREWPFIEACSNLSRLQRSIATDAEWADLLQKCNKAERRWCITAWFRIEKAGIPTSALACRPNDGERAEEKRREDEANSPDRKGMFACLDIGIRGDKIGGEERNTLISICNQSTRCKIGKELAEQQTGHPLPELTCPRSK
jgi:hypothetical protein